MISSVKPDNLLTLITHSLKTISLKVGDIVNAEVLEVMDSGNVSLRIKSSNTARDSAIIIARSGMLLTKGDVILLKVAGLGQEIKLQFVGMSKGIKAEDNPLIRQIQSILSEMPNSGLKVNDVRIIKEFFRSMPETMRTVFPEFRVIEKLLPEIAQMSNTSLKTLINASGVMFEARLKLAAMEDSDIEKLIMSDLKGLLLKVKGELMNEQVLKFIQMSGLQHGEITGAAERLLKAIEFFQLTSYINNVLYTFLPVSWQGLRNGEIIFRKGREDKDDSYSCEINLDLEKIGKLSAAITLFNKLLYVSFYAERPETVSLIISQKKLLENRFVDAGLSLQAVNISHKQDIDFNAKEQGKLDIKV